MRAEWIRVHTPGRPVDELLRLVADDDSEIVVLLTDELALVEQTIRAERGLIDTSWGEGPDVAEISAETVDHTGAGNAGVVSEPVSPPAVVGDLDDAPEVVEAPPKPKRPARPGQVTGDHVVAWLEVNPASQAAQICRGLDYKSSGSMGTKLHKLLSEGRIVRDENGLWSAATWPTESPSTPTKPPVPPRPAHSNPSDGLAEQLVEIVETHGPMTAGEAHACLPFAAQARYTANDVVSELGLLADTERLSRPRRNLFDAAS